MMTFSPGRILSTFRFFILLTVFGSGFYPESAVAQEKTVTYYADPSGIPPDLPVKLKHLTARVSFRPELNEVSGTAEFTFTWNREPYDSIIFSTPEFSVSAVTIDGIPAKFRQASSQLIIAPPPIPHPSSHIPHPESPLTPAFGQRNAGWHGEIYGPR